MRTYLTTREAIVAAAKEAIRTMFDRGIPGYMPADFERAYAFAKVHRDRATFAAQREARREAVTSRYPMRYPNYMPSRPARGGEL